MTDVAPKPKNDPAYHRAYYRKNKARWKESELRLKYGLTVEEFDAMLASHDGGCWVCGATVAAGHQTRLHVDHCHTTGQIRGLLCSRCNLTLGRVDDDPSLLRALADYLEAQWTP